MAMDVSNSRKIDLKSEIIGDEQTTVTVPVPVAPKTVKRPFDVAFLMLPDEKIKQKQCINKITKIDFKRDLEEDLYTSDTLDDEDEQIEVGSNNDLISHMNGRVNNHQKYYTQKQQIFDDPTLIKTKNLDELRCKTGVSLMQEQKSAFTKVNMISKESRSSPNLSLSPDLSYQNSLSPSPPILTTTSTRNYHQNFPTNILTPSQIFKSQSTNAYHFPDNFNSNSLDNPFLIKTTPNSPEQLLQPNMTFHHKLRPIYRPELPYNYQQFPATAQDMLKITPPDIRSPAAAAILTSLLPPSLAALSMPAQNVCAKCNITFRMTSDLVYHMRSHHKNDSVDLTKRRREDKLKCPVCSESFRERHHLTRHMTAHQDKDEDAK